MPINEGIDMLNRKTPALSLVAITLAIGMLSGCHGGKTTETDPPGVTPGTSSTPATTPATPTTGESTDATTPTPAESTPGTTSTASPATQTPTKPPAKNADAVQITPAPGWTLQKDYFGDGTGYAYVNSFPAHYITVKLFDATDAGRQGVPYVEMMRLAEYSWILDNPQGTTDIVTKKVDGRTAWEFMIYANPPTYRIMYLYDAPNTYRIVCEAGDQPFCESMFASIKFV